MLYRYENGVKKFKHTILETIYGYAVIFCLIVIWYLPYGERFLKWHKKKMDERRTQKYKRNK